MTSYFILTYIYTIYIYNYIFIVYKINYKLNYCWSGFYIYVSMLWMVSKETIGHEYDLYIKNTCKLILHAKKLKTGWLDYYYPDNIIQPNYENNNNNNNNIYLHMYKSMDLTANQMMLLSGPHRLSHSHLEIIVL